MDFQFNAPIECLNGVIGGYINGLIVNPATIDFTHLVIKTNGIERIVPAALVRDAAPEGVLLACTAIRLNEEPHYIDSQYIRPIADNQSTFPRGGMIYHYKPMSYPITPATILSGE